MEKHPTLFDDPINPVAELEKAKAAGEKGMAQVAAKAEVVSPDFSLHAQAFILHFLALHGPTAGEVLNLQCKAAGIQPHDDRAFGPVYLSLARQQRIEIVGTVPRFRGHGAPGGRIWSLTPDGYETAIAEAECPHCGKLDCEHMT